MDGIGEATHLPCVVGYRHRSWGVCITQHRDPLDGIALAVVSVATSASRRQHVVGERQLTKGELVRFPGRQQGPGASK